MEPPKKTLYIFGGNVLSSKYIKKLTLIFQEIELSSPKLEKLLYFRKPEKSNQQKFENQTTCTARKTTKKNLFLRNFFSLMTFSKMQRRNLTL